MKTTSDKIIDKVTNFDAWCQRWKNWHTFKQSPATGIDFKKMAKEANDKMVWDKGE